MKRILGRLFYLFMVMGSILIVSLLDSEKKSKEKNAG